MRTRTTMAIALISLFLDPVGARAQGLTATFVAGLNRSTAGVETTDPDFGDIQSRTGFHLGALLTVAVAETFGVRFGGLYTQKGFNVGLSDPSLPVDIEGGIKLTYLELPLLGVVQVPAGENGTVTPRFFAGPAFGIEVGCKVVASGGGASASVDCDAGGPDAIATKSIDVGAMFGGGVAIAVGTIDVVVDLAYTLGLTNVDDSPDTMDDVKNRNLSLSLGVELPVGGPR